MDKKTICEAMYALPGDVVVRHKKSLMVSILVLVIGIVLVTLNYALDVEAYSVDISSSLLLLAGATIIVGLLLLCTRIFDNEGQPWHKATNRPLKYEERFYPIEQRREILRLVDEAAYLKLLANDKGSVSGIAVAIYRSSDLSFVAMQAYEYLDYEYHPLTDVRYLDRSAKQ